MTGPSPISKYRTILGFRPWFFELSIVLAIVLVGAVFGYVYLDRWGDPPQHAYRFWADAASGVALGKGLGQPDPVQAPEIEEFLAKKREYADLAKVPADCPVREYSIGSQRRAYLYLIHGVGWAWAWLGMSWKVLLPLHAIFWGATCGCVYGLFRLGVNRLLAVLGTALFVLGPNHLAVSALLRDYAKAPFILGCIFLMGLLLKKGRSPRIVLSAAAGIGALAGVGIGFREDVQVCLLPALLVLIFLLPRQPIRPVWTRVSAVLIMAAVYCGTGWPIIETMRQGSGNTSHAIAGGLSRACSSQMGVDSPDCQLLPVFNDGFIAATFQSYAHFNLKRPDRIPYASPVYTKVGLRLLAQYACHFPADCLRRIWASIASTTIKTPFLYGDPGFRSNAFIGQCAPQLLRLYWPLQGRLPCIILLVFVLIAVRDLRMGLGFLLLFAYFTAYPVLQYQYRHFFHLGFLFWWFPALLIQAVGGHLARWIRERSWWTALACLHWPDAALRRSLLRLVAVAVALLLGAAAAYETAWRIQQYQYARLMASYEANPLQPVDTEMSKETYGGFTCIRLHPKTLFAKESSANERLWRLRACYLVVEFQGCPASIPIYCAYDKEDWAWDFSGECRVPPTHSVAGRTRLFIPVYDVLQPDANPAEESHFLGLDVPEAAIPYFRGLYRAELADYELPLFVSVPEDWRERPTPYLKGMARKPHGDLLAHMTQYLNLLGNGSFEQWPVGAPAPLACQAPKAASIIARESVLVSDGRSAVRQTWDASDKTISPLERFGIYLAEPKSNAVYGVAFDASNETAATVAVQLCLVTAPPNSSPALLAVGSPVPVPGKTDGFKTFSGSIQIEQVPPDSFLMISTVMLGDCQPGASVAWDRFYLAPLPDF